MPRLLVGSPGVAAVSLAERKGLQSVMDIARKHAEAGYPDFMQGDPGTFDADFFINKEREGVSVAQSLETLVAFKRSRGHEPYPLLLLSSA